MATFCPEVDGLPSPGMNSSEVFAWTVAPAKLSPGRFSSGPP